MRELTNTAAHYGSAQSTNLAAVLDLRAHNIDEKSDGLRTLLPEFDQIDARIFVEPLVTGALLAVISASFEAKPVIKYDDCALINQICDEVQDGDRAFVQVAVDHDNCRFP